MTMPLLIRILMILLCTVSLLLILLLILIVIPFNYIVDIGYRDDKLDFSFKYFILSISAFISLNKKTEYNLKIFNKAIFDNKKKENSLNNSAKQINKINGIIETEKKGIINDNILYTDFINDKSVSDNIDNDRNIVKKLILDSKREVIAIKNSKTDNNIDKTHNINFKRNAKMFFDKLYGLIPYDMIYVMKKVSFEVINLLEKLKPSTVKIDVEKGFDEPFSFGIMSGASSIISSLGKEKKLKAVYDADVFNANIYLKRKVMLLNIIIPVLRLLRDKKFRTIVFNN